MRSHTILTRLAKIKKPEDNRCWGGCGAMGKLLWEVNTNAIILGNNMETSWKLKLYPPSASDSPPGIHPREILACVQGVCNRNIIIKSLKQPKCPLARTWTHKFWYIHTNGILSNSEKWMPYVYS